MHPFVLPVAGVADNGGAGAERDGRGAVAAHSRSARQGEKR